MNKTIKITLLAGGVGGAKMAEGFSALQNVELSIIGKKNSERAISESMPWFNAEGRN